MPVGRVAALARGTGARRLTDEHHANAEHDNITWKQH